MPGSRILVRVGVALETSIECLPTITFRWASIVDGGSVVGRASTLKPPAEIIDIDNCIIVTIRSMCLACLQLFTFASFVRRRRRPPTGYISDRQILNEFQTTVSRKRALSCRSGALGGAGSRTTVTVQSSVISTRSGSLSHSRLRGCHDIYHTEVSHLSLLMVRI